MFRYFDAHSHIHGSEYDADREAVLERMRERGVGTITIGTHFETSQKAAALAEKERDVWASVGLHPTDTGDSFEEKDYEGLSQNPKVVAIGECGLDYFRLPKDAAAEKARQKDIFLKQLNFAVKIGKPLMIHCRPSGLPGSEQTMDAHEDMIAILESAQKEHGKKVSGNIHFFTGTPDIARRYSALDFTISFSGVITFAKDYDELIRNCPLETILTETDAPYASPVPHRGGRNEPSYVVETVRRIALIRGEREEDIAAQTTANALRVFGIEA